MARAPNWLARAARAGGGRTWLIAASISASLLLLLATRIDVDDLRVIAAQLRPAWLLPAFGSYLCINCVIAWRLKSSFAASHALGFRRALGTTIIHSLMLAVLPVRLGDLYYPILLRSQIGTAVGPSLGNLILLRLYDLCAIALLFVVSILLLGEPGAGQLVLAPLLALAATSVMIFLLPGVMAVSVRALLRIGGGVGLARRVARIGISGRRWLLATSSALRLKLFVLTLLRWLLAMVTLSMILRCIGVELGIIKLVFVGSGMNMALIVPLQTIGSFGVAEISMAVLFVITGMESKLAASAALFARLLWLLLPVSLGTAWYAVRAGSGSAGTGPNHS